MRWHHLFAALLIIMFLAVPFGASQGQSPPARFKLASWSLSSLAERDGAGCNPRTESDYQRLREFVAAIFDRRSIVAIQDVESAAAAVRIFPREQFTVIVSSEAYPYPPPTCPGSSAQATPRRVGFAIGRDLRFRRNSDHGSLSVGQQWPLPPGVDLTMETRFGPVRLLSISLAPGCPNLGDAGLECDILTSQISPLEEWVEARGNADQPFAILGDFNRHIGASDVEFWALVDDGEPNLRLRVAAVDFAPSAATQACAREGGSGPISHLVLSRTPARHVVAGSYRQEPTTASGSCPVMISVR